MMGRGAVEAQQRLEQFADRVIQQVDDWARFNLSVLRQRARPDRIRPITAGRATIGRISVKKRPIPSQYEPHRPENYDAQSSQHLSSYRRFA